MIADCNFPSQQDDPIHELFTVNVFGPLTELVSTPKSVPLSIYEIDPTLYSIPFWTYEYPAYYSIPGKGIQYIMAQGGQIALRDFIRRLNGFLPDRFASHQVGSVAVMENQLVRAAILQALLMEPVAGLSDMNAWAKVDLSKLISQNALLACYVNEMQMLMRTWDHGNKRLKPNTIIPAFLIILIDNLDVDSPHLTGLSRSAMVDEVMALAEEISAMDKPSFANSMNSQEQTTQRMHRVKHSQLFEDVNLNEANRVYLEIVRAQ